METSLYNRVKAEPPGGQDGHVPQSPESLQSQQSVQTNAEVMI